MRYLTAACVAAAVLAGTAVAPALAAHGAYTPKPGHACKAGYKRTVKHQHGHRIVRCVGEGESDWSGTMTASSTRVYNEQSGPYTCSDAWTGTLSIQVETSQQITGSLALTENGTVNCDFPFTPEAPATSVNVTVTGTASPSAFSLVFGPATFSGPQLNYAGLPLLWSTDPCTSVLTGPPLAVPLVGSTHADGEPQLQYTMGSDCAGAVGDVMSVNTSIALTPAT